MTRRPLRVILAFAVAFGLLAMPATGPGASGPLGLLGARVVRAATPDLTIVSAARYDVQPAQQRVRVTVDLTLTNHLHDTKTTRYYFDQAFLNVLPNTAGFVLTTSGSGKPSVTVTRRTATYTMLRLGLGTRLYGGHSASYQLRFDLRDQGGSAARDVRIGDSLVAIPVWAFATDATPGSSSTVVFPSGYDVRVEAGSIPSPTKLPDGRTVFRTGSLSQPLTFFAYLVADRPGSYRQTSLTTTVRGAPVQVVVRSWPDDKPWQKRVTDLLKRGLPALGDAVGLDWPKTDALTVQESVSRTTEGYAGLFDPTANRVEIAYYADTFVVLHEAAHGWFNGALLADRWANEAFASYYAERAAAVLKVKVAPDALTAKLRAAAFPLNAWGPIGTSSTASEDYAYAASLQLAREIAKRAGPDTMKAVWADAAGHVAAYQDPGGTAETVDAAVDWRGLLDLLEERTGTSFSDLWRTWVARPEDLPLLDARDAARTKYSAVLARLDGWRLPREVRDALRTWRFDEASAMLDGASAALDQRAQVATALAGAGLTAPTGTTPLQTAFENDGTFEDVAAETQTELAAIDRYQKAVALRRPVDPANLIMYFGMWGQTPDADLATARDAFARGALSDAVSASDAAAFAWGNAEAIGRGRVLSVILLLVTALVALILITARIQRRRRRRHRHAMMARRLSEGTEIQE